MKIPSTLFILGIGLLSGCENQSEIKFETYTISRAGMIFPEEQFDVIDVYGFSDNRAMAEEITAFLNKQEPGTYRYYPNQ